MNHEISKQRSNSYHQFIWDEVIIATIWLEWELIFNWDNRIAIFAVSSLQVHQENKKRVQHNQRKKEVEYQLFGEHSVKQQ